MSRIDDLIAEHCPAGVQFRLLGDVCDVFSGSAFASTLFNRGGRGLPLIRIRDVNSGDSGTFYSGSYDARYVVEDGDLLVGMDGDFRAIRWSRGRALLNQRVCRLQNISEDVDPDFLYYIIQQVLTLIQEGAQQSTVKHLSSRELRLARLPVPPLPVQREVVATLSGLGALQVELKAELQSELELRLRQYAYYRDSLLSFADRSRVRRATLSEVGSLYSGLTGKAKADFHDGNARFVTYMNVFNNLATCTTPATLVKVGTQERQNEVRYGDVLFTASSESAEEVGMASGVTVEPPEPLYLNSFCFGFRPNDPSELNPEFSKHLFRSAAIRSQIIKTANGVTRINISKARFRQVEIPIPAPAEQARLAALLDRFQARTNELSVGLAAEIKERQAQYEYYRDRLLTFEEVAA